MNTDPASPKPPADDPVATFMLEFLGRTESARPQDVAEAFAALKSEEKRKPQPWKRYFGTVKQQAIHLARQGRIEMIRNGAAVDPNDFKGLVRLRLPRG